MAGPEPKPAPAPEPAAAATAPEPTPAEEPKPVAAPKPVATAKAPETKPVAEPKPSAAEAPEPEPAAEPKPAEPKPVATAKTPEPKPAAEPAPGGGVEVRINSAPPGAAVWIGGRERGRTPLAVRLPRASTRVTLVHAGHRLVKASVDPADRASLDEKLSAIPAPARGETGVRVDCTTPGRYPVLVDGEETGLICPTGRIPLTPGTHKVALYLPETDDTLEREVEVTDGIKSIKLRK
jgi:outer membrane biosynthesis protein TonB